MAIETSSRLRRAIDDNVLNPVSAHERMGGWALLANTAGVGTTLAMLLVGGAASYLVGVQWTIVLAALCACFGAVVGTLTGCVSQSTGMSSTVTMRFHGLGAAGSALASLIFSFMILGFLALENMLLYNGTLFLLGWAPTPANALLIYGTLTILWIVLSLFGMRVVQKTSFALTIAAAVLLIWVGGVAFQQSGRSVSEILIIGPTQAVGTAEIMLVLNSMVGMAGALSLVGADFARYARAPRDVRIMAVGGSVIVTFAVVSFGGILYQVGETVVAEYLSTPQSAQITGALLGDTIAAKVLYLAETNTGAYFVILGGILGFLVMYTAQIKAQVINVYSGSLSLSNLFDSIFRKKVNRSIMILIANAVAMIAMWANILGMFLQYLELLGILTFSLCALIITDFYVIRRKQSAGVAQVERVNWAGIAASAIGSSTAYFFVISGIFPLGFIITLIVTPFVYIFLRATILKSGVGTDYIEGTSALRDEN